MKVAIITSFPFPDGKATANRVAVFADQLVASRIADEVSILSTSFEAGSTVAVTNKIKAVSIKVSVIDKRRLFWRAVNEAVVSLNLWRKARQEKPEITIVTIPSPLLLLPLIVLRKKEILVLDVRDAVWDYLGDQGLRYLLRWLLTRLFAATAKKADLISVTNGHEAKSVLAISNIMPLIVPNGISSAKLAEFSSMGLKEPSAKLNVTYVGNVGIAQELEILVEFALLNRNRVNVDIVGDGAMLPALKSLIDERSVTNVTIHGHVPHDAVGSHVSKADILFAQIGKDFSSAVPTKVFEYVASGRKVLLGLPAGPAVEIFSAFDGVTIFPTGDLSGMQAAFEQLCDRKFTKAEFDANLLKIKKIYLRENTTSVLVSELHRVISASHT